MQSASINSSIGGLDYGYTLKKAVGHNNNNVTEPQSAMIFTTTK